MSTIMQETTSADGPTVDVLALTPQERWAERARFWHLEDGRYHLSGIKGSAGIGSRETHITLEQVKAMHRELGRIVDELDEPASHGPTMAMFFESGRRSVADVATDAGVDADALHRHLDGEGPLSALAYERVIKAMVGVKAATA
jgi:hypothetical protein